MSKGADHSAPTKLTFIEVMKIYTDPSLAVIHDQKKMVQLVKERQELTSSKHANDPEVKHAINDLCAHAKALTKQHDMAITQELWFLLQWSRAQYFAEASSCQPDGEMSHSPTTPTLLSTFTIGSSQLSRYQKPCVSAILAQARAEIPPDWSISTTSCTYINKLISHLYGKIPEANYHKVLCYPGESLTDQDHCPMCGSLYMRYDLNRTDSLTLDPLSHNVMKRSTAHHIHHCLVNRKKKEANTVLDGGYVALQFCWAKCMESDQL
ncbi:hypothetical protein L210DRAFT_3645143 [Boletus edulis BED1]|uniref:Uncharacterized protein n=1 Tax=Boletus edulis BED1 TaxID=1328754 RepID=A0AAD4BVA1_BOLED|nr:hypothetical protein L210DRAFT_3645143 [Boletus edulis BED1]